ncbi:hypothetical protein M3210_15300 [Oceanobacillus luteolus]|uniref:Uncharacterized protein n=1 Tax=Oceanobacillus luteolus TaxID=1274358 RepID=A0ABW4HVN1_9BACI|nr:hypothetical protein [Oceanobacillus luteolus]MCM3741618.1 hypothetical protein [Oceanobacillus luteolus]
MKNYLLFSASFIVLFGLFQILWGMALTFFYTPDVTNAWLTTAGQAQEETTIFSYDSAILPTFIIAFLSASIAYIISRKFAKKSN